MDNLEVHMKLFKYLAVSALAAFMALPINNSVEAATVALLPMINNVVERDDLSSIYYDRAVSAVKINPELEIVESEELDKAVEKFLPKMQLPDKVACEAIVQAAGVDYIFIIQADEMTLKEPVVHKDDFVTLGLKGRCVSYSTITGKYVNKSIIEEDKVPGATLARYDMMGKQFGNSVTREIKKALGIKKFTVEKQRIGLKGDRR